jgi:methylmalonyl-CoA/ethylmalonyl-CoA epimerase
VIRGVSHLGIAVRNLDEAVKLYESAFGLRVERRWVAEAEGIEAASLRVGEVEIELMQPLDEESPVGRFIARRGEGIHHVSYRVDDMTEAVGRARAAGLETVGEEPRSGGEGRTRVVFIHPKGVHGVLTELEEDVDSG